MFETLGVKIILTPTVSVRVSTVVSSNVLKLAPPRDNACDGALLNLPNRETRLLNEWSILMLAASRVPLFEKLPLN